MKFFKSYAHGKETSITTECRALLTILEEHHSNKFYNSRLLGLVELIYISNLKSNLYLEPKWAR